MTGLSIVIPCYNEAGNLPALVDKCLLLLQRNNHAEIILVNNGSTDNSSEIMERLLSAANNPFLRSHHVLINKGYGYGILEGLNNATGNVLCWTHADLQTDIFDCIKAYNLWLVHKNDLIIIKGKRKGRKLFDVLFTAGMQWYVLYRLNTWLSDINGQPKLFSKTFYDLVKAKAPYDFSLDLYLLVCAKRSGSILDFPVYFAKRQAGEAKGGSGNLRLKFKLAKRTLQFINAFNRK